MLIHIQFLCQWLACDDLAQCPKNIIASYYLMLTNSRELPPSGCSAVFVFLSTTKISLGSWGLLAAVKDLFHSLWGGTSNPGAQSAPGNAAIGGWGSREPRVVVSGLYKFSAVSAPRLVQGLRPLFKNALRTL